MALFKLNIDESDSLENLKLSNEDKYLLLANEIIHSPDFFNQIPKYIELRKNLELSYLIEYKELDSIIKAFVYGWVGEIEKSFQILSSVFKKIDKKSLVYKGHNSIYGFINLYMSTIFIELGNSIHKSEYFREAIKTYREDDDYNGLAKCYELQAKYYKSKNDYINEIQALLETVKYYRFNSNTEEVIKCQIRIAVNYAFQEKQDDWEKYTELALDKINMAEASPLLKAYIYKSIGIGYKQFGMIEEAIDSFRKSIINYSKNNICKEYIDTYQLLESSYKENGYTNEVASCQKNIIQLIKDLTKIENEEYLTKLEILHLIQIDEKIVTAREDYEGQIMSLKNKLQITNEENERMIVLLSHDLREPVRGITSFASLLDRSLSKKETNEKEKEYLTYIKKNANIIAGHIEYLLKYIQLENNSKEISEIDLNDIVRNVKEEIMQKRNDKNVILSYTKLPTIRANKELINSLFYNLIDNAVKFNVNTPLVKIDYSNKKHEIAISDNGIGISDENKEKVFELFRKEHKNSNYDGWGVGLSISRKIVNSMGGDIKIEDNTNGGIKVKFDFAPEIVV